MPDKDPPKTFSSSFAAKVEEPKVEKKEEPKEKKEEPKRRSLMEQLEDVVEKLEKHTTPFSQEDTMLAQGLGKRLSRTLGAYREPASD
jgi:hypothetical protein